MEAPRSPASAPAAEPGAAIPEVAIPAAPAEAARPASPANNPHGIDKAAEMSALVDATIAKIAAVLEGVWKKVNTFVGVEPTPQVAMECGVQKERLSGLKERTIQLCTLAAATIKEYL